MRTAIDDARELGILDRCTISGVPLEAALKAEKKPSQKPCAKRQNVLIKLPLPPRELHPNGRAHWSKVAKVKKEQRTLAESIAKESLVQFVRPVISVMLYHADGATRDRDGIIASLKGAIDGLADAGLFANDSTVTWASVECAKVLKPIECVILKIKERKP